MSSDNRFLRLPELVSRTGLSKSTIYKMIREGAFPDSIPIYGQSVAWLSSEVSEWADARVSDRDHELRKAKKLKGHKDA